MRSEKPNIYFSVRLLHDLFIHTALSHIWFSTRSPIVPLSPVLCFIHFLFVHSVFPPLPPSPPVRFFSAFFLCLFRVRFTFPLVSHLFFASSPFILHLFSICSPFVFRPPYVCFSFFIYFYAHFVISSSFVPHLFFSHLFPIYFSIYSSFHSHLSTPPPPPAVCSLFFHEAKYGSCAVKAQYRFVA